MRHELFLFLFFGTCLGSAYTKKMHYFTHFLMILFQHCVLVLFSYYFSSFSVFSTRYISLWSSLQNIL